MPAVEVGRHKHTSGWTTLPESPLGVTETRNTRLCRTAKRSKLIDPDSSVLRISMDVAKRLELWVVVVVVEEKKAVL